MLHLCQVHNLLPTTAQANGAHKVEAMEKPKVTAAKKVAPEKADAAKAVAAKKIALEKADKASAASAKKAALGQAVPAGMSKEVGPLSVNGPPTAAHLSPKLTTNPLTVFEGLAGCGG